jgi:uncharacterized membrane protein YcaP (DUF421 family)
MDWQDMFFQGWEGIIRTLVVGVLAYVSLVAFLRISGKRTLAKLNAFDLVVTVALGSTLSAILVNEGVALAEGAAALSLLILMQYLVAAASVRWDGFARIVRSEPGILVRKGEFCRHAMVRERVTEREILSAVRASGATGIQDADLVVMESDGTISVISSGDPSSALSHPTQ